MRPFSLVEYHLICIHIPHIMPKGLSSKEFIEKAKLKHGDEYDYSLASYVNYLTPVTIICREHGQFEQKPNNHLYGAKCPSCSMTVKANKLRDDLDAFVQKAMEKFGDKYSYKRVVYKDAKTPVIITCNKHGDFIATPNAFLTEHTGCTTCTGSRLTTPAFIARAKAIHGNKYDYSRARVAGYHGVVTITCPDHGDFEQTPNNHLQGKGCSKCIGRIVSDTQSFVDQATKIHCDKYDYSLVEYTGSTRKVKIVCKKHGVFSQIPANHLNENGCPKCVSKVSKPEIELFDFILNLCPDAKQSDRSIIGPLELDIVIPSKAIAIEYNGLYFHSDRLEGRKDDAHKRKMLLCEKAGYRLIQVWEDDWNYRRGVVEKTLRHILGASQSKIGARACVVRTRGLRDVVEFFELNHLQSAPRRGIAYTLEHCDEIVAAMVFSPVASERGKAADGRSFELIRYATAKHVAGGASRLMAAFLRDTPECNRIISYSNNEWFDGRMYATLGFKHIADVEPDYKVVDGKLRRHKINYKLSELKKRFGNAFDPLLSERENCRNNGLFRVYDSGLKKWEWRKLSSCE